VTCKSVLGFESPSFRQRTLAGLHKPAMVFAVPATLWEIPPLLSGLYPDRIISSELREPEALLSGLREGVYQLAVLPFAVEEAGLACTLYKEEHLFFSLPPAHPLSGRKGLYLNDLNGETMLLLNRLGIWETIVHQRMPDTRFLVQEDFAFETLVRSSALPSFTSDMGLKYREGPRNRINIPVLDPEANITYYCVYRSEAHKELRDRKSTRLNSSHVSSSYAVFC